MRINGIMIAVLLLLTGTAQAAQTFKIATLAPDGSSWMNEMRAAAEEIEQGIKDGTFNIFTGPITDQTGAERVPAGETIPDEQLLTMDWYVEGVQS
ncbi:MAG: hypothetical protein KY410_06175 [Proteobacteria bacterium]|nr:hypothetical protein [Pseudomonadota bacterium]